MSSPIPTNIMQISRSAISAPAPTENVHPVGYFDYRAAISLRKMAIAANLDVPMYLLAPEIAVLLSYIDDLHKRFLINTLWNTGARINEALALTPANFHIDGSEGFVVLKTLKQRQRGKGRPLKNQELQRAVPLLDAGYIQCVNEYLSTFRLRRHEPIWNVTDDTVRNWIKAAITAAERDNVTFSISPVTPKTFRHSFGMHLVQSFVPLKVVQAYMGHQEISSTEVYTKVFALDVGRHYGVRFCMNINEAIKYTSHHSLK